jgi:hypothetical protein
MEIEWLTELKKFVRNKPLILLRFESGEHEFLVNSRFGYGEFTFARAHDVVAKLKVPAPCLIFASADGENEAYFGAISTRGPITTLDSRLKVRRGASIEPTTESALVRLVRVPEFKSVLAKRLKKASPVIYLSPKLSEHLVGRLASIASNQGALRSVASSLVKPRYFRGNAALQDDALRSAFATFGLGSRDRATRLELIRGRESSLSRVEVMEDAVIEHDARSSPGFKLVGSDLTGRAVFEKAGETLEVITANRRPLERCLGVDLIYFNKTKQNIVMLQYKMLNPLQAGDWIYRPDAQLNKEIGRMDKFLKAHAPSANEYRMNPSVFYLKFVKNNALISSGAIITPLDHFKKLRADRSMKGPRNGLRVSYKSLNGRYLRQAPFFDLIRAGYIGAYAKTTRELMSLIAAILGGNHAVVTAIQSRSR